jgi:antitoxin CptB
MLKNNIINFTMINITDLKKKILYRSTYRGTKEMDKLLTSFTKKYIDKLDLNDLLLLCDLLNIDDENLYKFNQGKETTTKIKINKISILFKKFVYEE